MAQENPRDWLDNWAKEYLVTPAHVTKKSDMRALAAACARDADAAGIHVIDLKMAAEGDLELYLVGKQNAVTDHESK